MVRHERICGCQDGGGQKYYCRVASSGRNLPIAPLGLERLCLLSAYLNGYVNSSMGLSKKNHGGHGEHGEERGKGLMEERFSMTSNEAYPRDPCVPRGWASF